jgi:hypothetical protein
MIEMKTFKYGEGEGRRGGGETRGEEDRTPHLHFLFRKMKQTL